MSTNMQRTVIFVLAGIVDFIVSAIQGFGTTDWLLWFIVSGMQGVILYEIMNRTQALIRLITLPVYGALYLLIRSFTGNLVWSILYNASNFDSLGLIELYTFPFSNIPSLILAAILVIAVYFLISGNTISFPRMGRMGDPALSTDKIMLEVSDDLVTRLLCASAVTQGGMFRKKVLNRVQNQYAAVAPEFGLDLELLTGVCQFLERRETKYQIAFLIAGLVSSVPGIFLGWLPLFLFTAPIMFVKLYQEKFDILSNFTTRAYDREKVRTRFQVEPKPSISLGLPKSDQNLVTYGGFSPFVGAGTDLGGWSFALDISRPKNHLGLTETVVEFDVSELYNEIEMTFADLNLPNLQIADLYFVSGLDIRNDREILPHSLGKPVQHIDGDYVQSVDDFRIRRYKHISVSAWGNDIIFSTFLRCVIRGKNLFVEAARYLLPPVSNQYRTPNQSTNKNLSHLVGMAMSSLLMGPIYGTLAGFFLLGKFANYVNEALGLQGRAIRNNIKNNPNYNYGVESSLREEVSGRLFLHYFQKFDQEMYVKIIDSELLETLLSFLDGHNVDTSQLRERQTAILNNGVFVQGGNIESENIAVGKGAKAVTNQKRASARKE